MRISVVVVMLVAACGSSGGQPDHPDGPASDAPRDGADPGSGSGSGSGSDPLADYRSGTRIKMQVLTTPDGAKQFQGWFDTQRNEACSFVQAADGVTRCLPSPASITLFTDAACSAPAAQMFPASAACTKYLTASVTVTATCPAVIRYGALLPAMVASPTPSVFTKSGTACVAGTVQAGAVVLVASGPEIPPSSFQSATLAVE